MHFIPRVKICGITSVADARAAVCAGADAIGLVFYRRSPRAVTLEQAKAIALAAGPFVTVTGLFVDPEPDHVRQVLREVPLQLLQFHGRETPSFCESFGRAYMKALRMSPELDVKSAIAEHPGASAVLLDAYVQGVPGGTGQRFDWRRVPQRAARPIVLAGGLRPDNVAAAIAATRPEAVDVSGGVESEPGSKDPAKMEAFITRARAVHE